MNEPALVQLAEQVGEALRRNGFQLVTAESCTGGWVSACCTAVAGSSDWFSHGIVSYSNEAKQRFLGVQSETLARWGAVSEAVALEMAEGARGAHGGRVAVAITGIAGPGGAVPDKPVGTVWIAWSWPADRLGGAGHRAVRHRFEGDRASVRRASVSAALQGVSDLLDGLAGGLGSA